MQAPTGLKLKESVWATPTIVMFDDGKEVSRYTGYDGNKQAFWRWFGQNTMTPEQKRIAFEDGTEPAFSGSLLDNHLPGYYVTRNLCKFAADNNLKIGFYGGEKESLDKCVLNLRNEYQGLEVDYVYSPPFRSLNNEEKNASIFLNW